jgi:hypothetical protein
MLFSLIVCGYGVTLYVHYYDPVFDERHRFKFGIFSRHRLLWKIKIARRLRS